MEDLFSLFEKPKNPLTFKDIDPTQASAHAGIPRSPIIGSSAAEVHNQGEVWCVMLWEARAGLTSKVVIVMLDGVRDSECFERSVRMSMLVLVALGLMAIGLRATSSFSRW